MNLFEFNRIFLIFVASQKEFQIFFKGFLFYSLILFQIHDNHGRKPFKLIPSDQKPLRLRSIFKSYNPNSQS